MLQSKSMSLVIKRIDFDPEFEPLTDRPIIEHEVIEGAAKFSEIVGRARSEAARIRRNARDVLAEARVEKEEERRRGHEEGHAKGLELYAQKIVEAGSAKEKVLNEAEPEIIRMVMEIAEKVIGREVKKGAVIDVVKKSIAESVGDKITVRVHPLDVPVLKEKESELLSLLTQTQSVSVKEDEGISRGGCIIETELGTVDSRLETQLGAIKKALGL